MFKRIVVGLSMVLSLVGISPAFAQSNCQSTLAYLGPKLRNYQDPMLQQMRTATLNTSISTVIENIRKQGLSLATASDLMLKQSKVDDDAIRKAEECAKQAASNEALVKQITNDTLSLDLRCEGTFNLCACSYIIATWLKLANRETAIQVACYGK